jgi:hypothetical protein
MNRKAILMLVVPLMMAAATARAESDLGSPKTERTFSADYKQAVDAAFPRYQDAGLRKRIDTLLQKYPAGRDTLQIWKLDQLERVLSLPHMTVQPGQMRIISPEREYGADRARGRVFLFQKPEALKPVTLAEMKQRKPQIAAFHDDLLTRIGIPADEVLYKRTELIVGQATTDPSLGIPQKTVPVVHGVRTYVLRDIDGIQVEDSSVSLLSRAPGRIDSLEVRWPPFALAPQAKTMAMRSRSQVQEAIVARVKELARGAKASLKMAVVLRRVQAGDQSYYVPAMKVGLRTEGEGEGAIFYEPLTGQAVVERKGEADTQSGGRD